MLEIAAYPLGPLATNAYVLTRRDAKTCIVIDPGMNPERLIDRVRELDVEAILLTHAHFDHIGGVEQLRRLKGCPVYVHEAEADWLGDPELNGSALWPEVGPPITVRPADRLLAHGGTLQLLGESFRVYHTPGHSPGSVSFHWNDHLFSGDVLFQQSVGRTDLNGGSSKELYDSIHRVLFRLPDTTKVYPGHGPDTTIGFEKKHNPYV
jgi:glyoxylase-like metal-dependent hydrolase (beta-lactamase superfamily II)